MDALQRSLKGVLPALGVAPTQEALEEAAEMQAALMRRLGFVPAPLKPPGALMDAAWVGYPAGGPSRSVAAMDYVQIVTTVRLHADDPKLFADASNERTQNP